MTTKAEAYAQKRAEVNKRTIAVAESARAASERAAREQRDAIEKIEAERPRLAVTAAHANEFGLRAVTACEVMCDVDDHGDLRIARPMAVKATAVRDKLIPFLIEQFGAPPKKARRGSK